MIPAASGLAVPDFIIKEQPDRTYRMDLGGNTARGWVDGKEAVKQAIYRILNTERYEYIIYSWNYGIETKDLYGQPVSYVCPELERRITEALLCDSRITGVSDFVFNTEEKGVVGAKFTVHTIFGDLEEERKVKA